MSSRPDLPAGLPGYRRGICLGCDQRIVAARDAWCSIVGTADGSWLLAMGVEPYRAWSDDAPPPAGILLLGVAHRSCLFRARERLRRREVELPNDLPTILIEEPPIDDMNLDNLGLPPAPGVCAYCGARSTSIEHVVPQWISRLLNQHGGFRIRTPHGEQRKNVIPVTTNRVCVTCNTSWLSVLETDSKPILKPMILGNERTLSSQEQEVVASWAFKTSLMLDLAGDPVVPLGYYRTFALERRPARSSIVWLGAYKDSMVLIAYRKALRFDAAPGDQPKGLVSTLAIHRVVFQVLHHFAVGPGEVHGERPAAIALNQIWPVGPLVSWPRDRIAFGDTSLEELAGNIHDSSHRDPPGPIDPGSR